MARWQTFLRKKTSRRQSCLQENELPQEFSPAGMFDFRQENRRAGWLAGRHSCGKFELAQEYSPVGRLAVARRHGYLRKDEVDADQRRYICVRDEMDRPQEYLPASFLGHRREIYQRWNTDSGAGYISCRGQGQWEAVKNGRGPQRYDGRTL
ncbi:hypothetical protein C8R44DRAFT_866900 [Mycena epipterygia]|nr:hypothetical protein C8R44DRAFT_866900 [Mycena epipterygia]